MEIVSYFKKNSKNRITIWAKNNIRDDKNKKWTPKNEYQHIFLETYSYDTYVSDKKRRQGKTEALIIKSLYEAFNKNNSLIVFKLHTFLDIKNIMKKTNRFLKNSTSLINHVYRFNPFEILFTNGSKIIYVASTTLNRLRGIPSNTYITLEDQY